MIIFRNINFVKKEKIILGNNRQCKSTLID